MGEQKRASRGRKRVGIRETMNSSFFFIVITTFTYIPNIGSKGEPVYFTLYKIFSSSIIDRTFFSCVSVGGGRNGARFRTGGERLARLELELGAVCAEAGVFPRGGGSKQRAPHWFRLPNRRPRGRVGWGCLGRLIRGEMSRSFFARFLFSMFFSGGG